MKERRPSTNKIKGLIDSSLENIREMVDVNCVIGEPVTLPDASVLIPVSKVAVGFVSGGGEYTDLNSKRNQDEFPMAGGTGGGYSVSPIGFFVLKDNKFKMVHADKSSAYLTLLKNATEILKKMTEKKEK
ncbi:MAG: sporulation protein YtfJ [Clostridia bacterium]|nr:sporulation protein YtfJ [Clostridia bacterium]